MTDLQESGQVLPEQLRMLPQPWILDQKALQSRADSFIVCHCGLALHFLKKKNIMHKVSYPDDWKGIALSMRQQWNTQKRMPLQIQWLCNNYAASWSKGSDSVTTVVSHFQGLEHSPWRLKAWTKQVWLVRKGWWRNIPQQANCADVSTKTCKEVNNRSALRSIDNALFQLIVNVSGILLLSIWEISLQFKSRICTPSGTAAWEDLAWL